MTRHLRLEVKVALNYQNTTIRSYRHLVHGRLTPMRVTVQETDLGIYAEGVTEQMVKGVVIEQRGYLEGYIHRYPRFADTLAPWPDDRLAPRLVRSMIRAGAKADVGPMAAVAGAIAEQVGMDLLKRTGEVIIENGGDIFIKCDHEVTVAVFAGHSPLSMRVGLKLAPSSAPRAVCTSSGTVGHSLSKGSADAVCVLSGSCPLADAAATAIGNRVRGPGDLDQAIQWGRGIDGVTGILAIAGDKMGMWGDIELTPLRL